MTIDLKSLAIGNGTVDQTDDHTWRLMIPPGDATTYSDAQLTDYDHVGRFSLSPPIHLSVRAAATGDIHGTAGFGFWNHPFAPHTRRLRLPRAAWFFYGSPPNDMPLAIDVPGFGWKCATIDAVNWRFLSLAPVAPIGFLLMRVPFLYRRLWSVGQRAIKVSEHMIGDMIPTAYHDYDLYWYPDRIDFKIDGEIVYQSNVSPGGQLGFIAWVDNQYAVVTTQGRFKFGCVSVPAEQGLIMSRVAITNLADRERG